MRNLWKENKGSGMEQGKYLWLPVYRSQGGVHQVGEKVQTDLQGEILRQNGESNPQKEKGIME